MWSTATATATNMEMSSTSTTTNANTLHNQNNSLSQVVIVQLYHLIFRAVAIVITSHILIPIPTLPFLPMYRR
jgi:hypothetical protein